MELRGYSDTRNKDTNRISPVVILIISIHAIYEGPVSPLHIKLNWEYEDTASWEKKEKKIETSRLGIFLGGDRKIYIVEWGYLEVDTSP